MQGWHQGRGAEGFAGLGCSEQSPIPCIHTLLHIQLSPAGKELLNQECPKSCRRATLPGRFIKQSLHGWFSAPPLSPWQWEPFSTWLPWSFSSHARCLWTCGHGCAAGQGAQVMEVSKCALFLGGTLSKKCAEKWFGKWFGLEKLRFPSV